MGCRIKGAGLLCSRGKVAGIVALERDGGAEPAGGFVDQMGGKSVTA